MEILDLKALPLGMFKNTYQANKKEINHLKKLNFDKNIGGVNITTSNITVLNHPIFKKLSKLIDSNAEKYVKDVLQIDDKIKRVHSWATINYKGQSHGHHKHPGAFVSVVYYAKCLSGIFNTAFDRSAIQDGYFFDYSIKNFNKYNSVTWHVKTESNDMIAFPGWISHGSTPNEFDEPRILIGANYFLKGQVGFKDRISILNL